MGRRLRCRFGLHAMQPWALPIDVQEGLLADHWAWSARMCMYCDHASVRAVRIERTDGGTGSLHG